MCVLSSPLIVGTSRSSANTKATSTFPALGYFIRSWENPIFVKDDFAIITRCNLKKKDPDSWAIWPLVYQDPVSPRRRRRMAGDSPATRSAPTASPTATTCSARIRRGFDVFAQMVHGTQIALLVGFVSMGIAAAIGITLGALAGYFGGWVDMLLSRLSKS